MFVVAGHASTVMASYAYLFHIPMFFFLARYVERLHQKSMLQIIVQKFVTLMIPYFMVNIAYLIGRIELNLFGVQGLFYDSVLVKSQLVEYVKYIIRAQWNTDLGGPTWYLLCLFLAFILAKLVILLTGNKINIFTVILGTVLL